MTRTARKNRKWYVVVVLFSCIYLCLWLMDTNQSPAYNEAGRLVSGAIHLRSLDFVIFTVNPPLPRMCAAIPIACSDASVPDLRTVGMSPLKRHEHSYGKRLLRENPTSHRRYFKMGRLTVSLFILAGVFGLWAYCRSFSGMFSPWCATLLFLLSPYILGHSGRISPDVPAAAIGLVAVFMFWRWLKRADSPQALSAGVSLGLAGLCKFTLLVFYPLFVALWMLYRIPERETMSREDWRTQAKQLCGVVAISILIINCGYFFEGAFTPLKEFKFLTTTLTGHESLTTIPSDGANRFDGSGSWLETTLGYIPIPLPASMVQGIDWQRYDFERGLSSYLRGEHSDHGWWYYYAYALLVKMPLGTWGLLLLATVCTVFLKGYTASWRDELVIIMPGVTIFLFVSSQTGFSIHSRYILPALPFLFLWVSKVGRAFAKEQLALCPRSTRVVRGLIVFFFCWMVTSSIWVYPHSLSYFNELAAVLPTPEDKNYPEQMVMRTDVSGGLFARPFKVLDSFFSAGPKSGPRHLLDSNIDWGQDLFHLEDWYEAHPEARPFHVAYWGSYPLDLSKIESAGRIPVGPDADIADENTDPMTLGPLPGYYALSVNMIYGRSKQFRYFLHFEPVAMAGYSIYIYHITLNEANRVRRALGLPDLEKHERPETG